MQRGIPDDDTGRAQQPDGAVDAGDVPEIMFDKGAGPDRRLVLRDKWGGEVRMSTGMFVALAREAFTDRFAAMARIANADDDPGAR